MFFEVVISNSFVQIQNIYTVILLKMHQRNEKHFKWAAG